MSELSKEQVQMLRDAIIERLMEFDLPDAMMPNKGVIRVAYDVIAAYLAQSTAPVAPAIHPAAQPRKPLPDPDVARDKLADALAQGSAGSLVLAMAKEDDEGDDPDAKKRADFDALVRELQRVAMGGVMPRMTTWDAIKPAHMPTSKWIINNYRMGWRQLAEVADLQMDRKGGAEMEPVHRNGEAA